jgi:hypothetical protein
VLVAFSNFDIAVVAKAGVRQEVVEDARDGLER